MPPGPRRGGRVAQEFSTATMLTRSGPLGLQWKEVHRHQNEIKRQAAMRKTFSSQQVRGAGRAPHCTGKALSPRKYPFFSQHMRGSGTPRNGKALWPQKKGTLFFKRKALFSSKECLSSLHMDWGKCRALAAAIRQQHIKREERRAFLLYKTAPFFHETAAHQGKAGLSGSKRVPFFSQQMTTTAVHQGKAGFLDLRGSLTEAVSFLQLRGMDRRTKS